MKRLLWTVLVILCPLTTMAQQSSGLNELERRGELLGWEAVGRLDKPGGFCTGTLISDDLVLTAAHCVFDGDGQVLAPERLTFRAGFAYGRSIAERRGRQIAVAEGYSHSLDGTQNVSDIGTDVALVQLDRSISTSEAAPFRLHDSPREGESVSVLSYGKGREDALSRQADCNVTERYSGGIMAFDCNVTFGSSGAPVFVRYGTRVRILSLISGGRELGTNDVISFGMELPDTVAALKTQLRTGNARPLVSSGARRIVVGQRGTSSGGARFIKP